MTAPTVVEPRERTERGSRASAFWALSLAIVRGFLRDKASVFFAIVFPLMFLVLFGGLFANPSQSKVDLIAVGHVAFLDEMPKDARAAFEQTFDVTTSDDLAASIDEVRKGDADVAIEQQGNTLVAHYTQTDQVKAAVTQGVLQSFVDGTNVALSGKPPTYTFVAERVEDDSLKTIQYVTPGLLGWAVAMSASFGAAATLNGWRNSKLLRRLQLSPVSTRHHRRCPGDRHRRASRSPRWRSSSGSARPPSGCGSPGPGGPRSRCWSSARSASCRSGCSAGSVAKTTEGAVNMANFIVLPMAFLSGSFFPLDAAPGWLQAVAHLLPLWWLNEGMLDVMVRGEPASAVLLPMVVLATFAVVVTAVAARLFRWETT